MARKRMIHRDIWQSYEIKQCTFRQRLLFIGLITIADDDGRLKADTGILKGVLFPFDNFTNKVIEDDLKILDKINLIHYYSNGVVSNKYVSIISWRKYQKIDHPTESNLPPYEDNSRIVRETFGNDSESFSTNSNTNTNTNSKPKTIYLEFVKLTGEEYKKLIEQFGEVKTKGMVKNLNDYIGSKGDKYKSHYHTMLMWENRDKKETVKVKDDDFFRT